MPSVAPVLFGLAFESPRVESHLHKSPSGSFSIGLVALQTAFVQKVQMEERDEVECIIYNR